MSQSFPGNMQQRSVLIVEDEADIANLLALHVADLGVDSEVIADGAQAWSRLQQREFDLLILDLRLPGIDGVELCRRLRAAGNKVPVLMLTARSSELDRVMGLESGADDYVTKPFSIMEVMARVRALFRRVEMDQPVESANSLIVFPGLSINTRTREVIRDDEPIDLTAREFDLLAFFAAHPGVVFRRMQLLDQVWGYGHEGYEHTVNSHINRLRGKLQGEPGARKYIQTVWGVGYKFLPDEGDVAQ